MPIPSPSHKNNNDDAQQLTFLKAEKNASCVLQKRPCSPVVPLPQVGQRIKKKFGRVEYYGTIEYVNGSYLSIIYDDGDEEAGYYQDKDINSIQFVDAPLLKKTKCETAKPTQISKAEENRQTNCLFELQGLNKNDYDQKQQKLISGISCAHLTFHVLEFYLFTYERQQMWQRKVQDPLRIPYSLNPRMARHSFCNIYRELDRGTVFFKASILELFYSSETDNNKKVLRDPYLRLSSRPWNRREWIKQVLWRAYIYRLVNRVETFQVIQFANPTKQSLQAFLKRAREYRDQSSTAFFTGAHNVSGFDRYCEALTHTLNELDTLVDDFCAAPTSQDKLHVLRNLKLVQDFFAWQILCDMEMCGCLTIDFNFSLLGPGAKNGLDLIFRTKNNILQELKGNEKYLHLARILTALQESAFRILGLKFPYLDEKRLALKEIEHTLCEYNKYKCSKGMHTYRPGEKSVIHEDCFSCNGKNPEHGYYCDLCNLFCCSGCLKNACDYQDYNDRSFVCPPCRALESFALAC